MPFFNGTIVTKKLQNIIDSFENFKTLEQRLYPSGYSYCIADIKTICKKVFQSSQLFRIISL